MVRSATLLVGPNDAADITAIATAPPTDGDLVASPITTSTTRWLAAAAAIIVLVGGLGWISQRPRDTQPVTSEPTDTPYLAELKMLYAPQPPTAPVEVASTPGVAALVRLVDGSIITTSSETGAISPELRAIFDSIEPADAARWASTRTAISDTIAAAPVIDRGDALDGTVSLHRNGAVSGLCITRGDEVGCDWTATMSAAGQFTPTLVGATGSILLSGGSWYAVHVSPDGSTCPLDVEAEHATVTLAGQVIAVIRPSATATKVACAFGSPSDRPRDYVTATRPI